jgi:recombination DNA repair RAD52 pathway protein
VYYEITPKQEEILLKGLNPSRVAQRKGGGGKALSYLEAWDVKAHMNRVFGFTGWSWTVTTAEIAFEDAPSDTQRNWNVGYKVIGTLEVAGARYSEAAVGSATLPSRGDAHDMACKTAESDAFKRAAINLGDQFGLSLYNNGSTAPVVKQTLYTATERAADRAYSSIGEFLKGSEDTDLEVVPVEPVEEEHA